MLTLNDKLHIRAQTLWLIYALCRPTTWIVVMMIIRMFKFYAFGLGMYAGRSFPQVMNLHQMIRIFIDSSITPLLWLLPITIIAERLIVGPIFYKYVVSRAQN